MAAKDADHRPSQSMQPSPNVSNTAGAKQSSLSLPVRSLGYWELVAVCHALGGTPGWRLDRTSTGSTTTSNPSSSIDEKHLSVVTTQVDDEEKQLTFSPTSDSPCGLYKRVVDKRKSAWWKYQILASVNNACLVLQLLLCATLTALGASDKKKSTAITIIAAANTLNAGVIALLHNSGIPTRYRNDWDEWSKVEIYMMDIMQSGVVQANMTKEDVIATCQAMYATAFATVENNKPSSYIPSIATAVTHDSKKSPGGQSSAPGQFS